MKLFELDELIKSVCPIDGINSDGEIWFSDTATEEQKAEARDLIINNLGNVTE